ncbi:MAG: hypothetical protein PHQ34_04065 [Methanothrix sp.]|nr:hypothetical protein [Methanothrix sp.]
MVVPRAPRLHAAGCTAAYALDDHSAAGLVAALDAPENHQAVFDRVAG